MTEAGSLTQLDRHILEVEAAPWRQHQRTPKQKRARRGGSSRYRCMQARYSPAKKRHWAGCKPPIRLYPAGRHLKLRRPKKASKRQKKSSAVSKAVSSAD